VRGAGKWVCGSTGMWVMVFFFFLINWKIEKHNMLMGVIQQRESAEAAPRKQSEVRLQSVSGMAFRGTTY